MGLGQAQEDPLPGLGSGGAEIQLQNHEAAMLLVLKDYLKGRVTVREGARQKERDLSSSALLPTCPQ